ncbi:GntR family transcriptional regulator [Sutcliffiella halmapala]|uniref:GntR family transcriptional regulator n=1 Tax=Sutcliffiella halmapala TaxID=79882 RepID=UPI000994F8E3|nr:GntR family transcriptional regulator [Sutcliffiella halmapala]
MLVQHTIRGSTRDFSYNLLKHKILNFELEPGTKISEKEIAETLKVSRTPIREAFIRLSQEELLDIIPQSGTIVSRINMNYVEEGRFIREKVEREIVGLLINHLSEDYRFKLESNLAMQDLCVENKNYLKLFELDEEFHQILFYSCGKARTWKMIQQLNIHFNRLRVLRLSHHSNWEHIISQHKEIYRLIVNKDVEGAKNAMEEHLCLVDLEKDMFLERFPHFFI